jgi:predicted MFS family arabinose efflux permease
VDNLITLSFLWFLEGVGLSIWYVFLQAAVPKASSSQIWGKAYGLQNLAYYAPYALGAFIGGVLYTFLGVYLTFYTAALFLVLAPLPLIVMSLRGIRLER